MIERLVNLTWILLGGGAAVLSWRAGLTGPYGPDSGLFPFIAGLLVCAGGAGLMLARGNAVTVLEQTALDDNVLTWNKLTDDRLQSRSADA